MSFLIEDDLQFDFSSSQSAIRFDQDDPSLPDYHDLSNMSKVDFIVEDDDYVYFIEVKDPASPISVNPQAFLEKVQNETVAKSLLNKYVYTFLFRWSEEALNKSVRYITVVTLESALLTGLQRQINEKLTNQLSSKSSRWTRDPLQACLILNLDTWRSLFPQWPVTRISEQ